MTAADLRARSSTALEAMLMDYFPTLRFTLFAILSAALVLITQAHATILYSENFETLPLGPEWNLSNSGTGRARVTTEFEPIEGTQHLVLDDSANDAISSPAQAILRVDLGNYRNVVLQYRVKSLGNEPDWPFGGQTTGLATYDGVSISVNNGATWTSIDSLASLPMDEATRRMNLDSIVQGPRPRSSSEVWIRFSEFDNASAPIDGLAVDAIEITGDRVQSLQIEVPQSVQEGTGALRGFLLLSFPTNVSTEVTLSATKGSDLILPTSVIIPAGQISAPFEFAAKDDAQVNLYRLNEVEASILDGPTSYSSVLVLDDESLGLRLEMPETLVEGAVAPSLARVVLDRPADVPVPIVFRTDLTHGLTMPYNLEVPQGATEVSFQVAAMDDTEIQGTSVVTVTAEIPLSATATAHVRVEDNEPRTIQLATQGPLYEGTLISLVMNLSGSLTTPLRVHLTNLTPELITVPDEITVPAYTTQVILSLAAADNAFRDGSHIASIRASAPGFESSTSNFTLYDDELASLIIHRSPDLVASGNSGMEIELKAFDIEGNPYTLKNVEATLEFIGADGSVIPSSSSLIQITSGQWSGQVSLPSSTNAPVRLRVTGPAGVSAETGPLDPVQILPYTVGDLVWDARRERLYASVRASGNEAEANHIVAINPATGQIQARVAVVSDPVRLAMTSGGEFLYVALDGTASIARIDLGTFTVESSFSVGTSPEFGILFAGDLQTVNDQPDQLLVCPYSKGNIPRIVSPRLFDHGVSRTPATQTPLDIDRLQPTSDPSIFLGYSSDGLTPGLRLLNLDATGLEDSGKGADFQGCCGGIQTDGDWAFSTEGTVFDVPNRTLLGRLAARGVVCPDRAVNRVYFIEPGVNPDNLNRLSVFDTRTLAQVGQLSLPRSQGQVVELIRWGKTGLAFRTAESISFFQTPGLIPSEPPTDLQMSVMVSNTDVETGEPVGFSIEVSNLGPNPTTDASVRALFTNIRGIQRVDASQGTASTSDNTVELSALNLLAGAKFRFQVTVQPEALQIASCSARINSPAADPVPENNQQVAYAPMRFRSTPDSVNVLPIHGIDLLSDPRNGSILISGSANLAGNESFARRIIRVNPMNGNITQVISLDEQPRTLGLSSNGRYLYAGLDALGAVERIDLSLGHPELRIPLGLGALQQPAYAGSINVLPGDGTSFVASLSGPIAFAGAAAYDGAARRPQDTVGASGPRLVEPTSIPNRFVEVSSSLDSETVSTLVVDVSGIHVESVIENFAPGTSSAISTQGDLILTSAGNLIQISPLKWLVHLPSEGLPLVDAANKRAYMLNEGFLHAYDTSSFAEVGQLDLRDVVPDALATRIVRWGLDGLAILVPQQSLVLVRWSEAIAPIRDQDHDGLPDRWEARYFGTLTQTPEADPDGDGFSNQQEYAQGTSPMLAEAGIVRILELQETPAGWVLRYERTKPVGNQHFDVEQSSDLIQWTTAENGTETVLSAPAEGGASRETIQWTHPTSFNSLVFFRVRRSP